MKKLLILMSLFFVYSFSYSQGLLQINQNGSLFVEKVFDYPGKDSKFLYSNTQKWIYGYYKNPKEVITGEIENTMLKGKAASDITLSKILMWNGVMTYNFQIDLKDEKIRIQFTNFHIYTDEWDSYAEKHTVKSNGEFKTNSQAKSILSDTEIALSTFINKLAAYLDDPQLADDTW